MKLRAEGAGPPLMLSIGRQLKAGGQRADFEWQAHKTNKMVCGRGQEHAGQRAPVWACTCGFWFYKRMKELRERVPAGAYGIAEGAYVLLAGWGKVVEHEEGVRTEFARPLAVLAERPRSGSEMSDEKWTRWITQIGLPVIAPEEVDIAAQLYSLEMLDYTSPPKVAQVLFPDGKLIFVDPDFANTIPHKGYVLPKPTPSTPPPRTGFPFDLEKRYYIDDLGNSQTWWGVRNVPHEIMLHNSAQVERMLKSPASALQHPRG